MRKRKRTFWLIPLGFLMLGLLVALITYFPPEQKIPILSFGFPSMVAFLIMAFVMVFSFTTFLLKNARRGFFLGLIVLGFLLLSLFRLSYPFFFIILIAFFVMLDLVFSRRK